MAASSRFATVSEDDFVLNVFFFSFLKLNHLCIYTKTIIRLSSVILGEYSPIITSLSANNCSSINTQVI